VHLTKNNFNSSLRTTDLHFALHSYCKKCASANRASARLTLSAEDRKLDAMVNSAQTANRALGAPPPDFDRDSLRAYMNSKGYRSAITGKLCVLARGVDWMVSLDRHPNADGPYMLGLNDPSLLNVRLVASEEQLKRMGTCLPESEDFRELFQFALDDIMGRTDLAARAAHVARWEEALTDRMSPMRVWLRKMVHTQRGNDKKAKRSVSSNITELELLDYLRAIDFHDEYARAPIQPEADSFMMLTLDRVDNSKNHSAANTKATVFLLNGFGNSHSGGICYSRKKLLEHLLDQNLMPLTDEERTAVAAAHDAAA
jgi:hypothetical protein